jgi:hypothetical protein
MPSYVYLSGDTSFGGLAALDSVLVEWPAYGSIDSDSFAHEVTGYSVASNFISLGFAATGADGSTQYRAYGGTDLPKIRMIFDMGASTNIGAAVDQMVTDAPTLMALGGTYLTSDDIASGWNSTTTEAAAGRSLILNRHFILSSEIALEDLIKHDLRLAGLWIGFDSNAEMALKQIKQYVPTDPTLTTITLLREPKPTFEMCALGTLGGAEIKTNFDPISGEHDGPTYVVRNVEALSRNPFASTLEVHPVSMYSTPSGTPAPTYRDFTELMQPILGMYGSPYIIVKVSSPLTALGVNVGDGVSFTSAHIPNPTTGTRGATMVGVVLGKVVSIREAKIDFTIHAAISDIRGYAPACGVTAQEDLGSDLWGLTIRVGDPWSTEDWYTVAAGTDATDFFAPNDYVELYEWNDASPTIETGTVASVTSTNIVVQLDSAWTPGTSDWMLRYQSAPTADTSQQLYGYFADAEKTIGFAATANARRFGS